MGCQLAREMRPLPVPSLSILTQTRFHNGCQQLGLNPMLSFLNICGIHKKLCHYCSILRLHLFIKKEINYTTFL